MGEISTIGLDIAKSVFQIHGVDVDGAVVIRKRVSRAKVLEFFAALPPCLVGIEACPSAHHWSRKLQGSRPHDEADAAQLREGLSQAQQERRERCRRDL
jgi:transposase